MSGAHTIPPSWRTPNRTNISCYAPRFVGQCVETNKFDRSVRAEPCYHGLSVLYYRKGYNFCLNQISLLRAGSQRIIALLLFLLLTLKIPHLLMFIVR